MFEFTDFVSVLHCDRVVVLEGLILYNFHSLSGCGCLERTDLGLLANLALPSHNLWN